MLRKSIVFVITTLVIGMISGCSQKDSADKDDRLKVVATIGMVGDAVKEIAGDKVALHTLMGSGVDPHLYKATKGDIDRLDEADIIFYNGLHLESKMADILRKMSRDKLSIALAEHLDSVSIRYPTEFEGAPDPHVWFDLSLWRQVVAKTGAVLIQNDSVNASLYAENLKKYLVKIDSLHTVITDELMTIPPEQRILITAHDAFGYFGQAYGLEVRGLQGLSTVTEAGLYDITAMIDLLVSRKIKAVFVESSVSKKAIEAVVTGCREKGHEITIGGELFSDAMGEAGTEEGTYIGMVKHNVHTIVSSLR